MTKKATSIRLSDEARQKCEKAVSKGYTQSQFINQAILNLPIHDRKLEQNLLPHFCAIAESIAAIHGNDEVVSQLRKELQAVCAFLNFPPENI